MHPTPYPFDPTYGTSFVIADHGRTQEFIAAAGSCACLFGLPPHCPHFTDPQHARWWLQGYMQAACRLGRPRRP